jgi:hypothetical protein
MWASAHNGLEEGIVRRRRASCEQRSCQTAKRRLLNRQMMLFCRTQTRKISMRAGRGDARHTDTAPLSPGRRASDKHGLQEQRCLVRKLTFDYIGQRWRPRRNRLPDAPP